MQEITLKKDLALRKKIMTKTWDVVLYSGYTDIGLPCMDVYKLSCSNGTINHKRTTGILHIDTIEKGVSMINTAPCRYIAIDMDKYVTSNSDVKIIYTYDTPHVGAVIEAHMLNIGNGDGLFIPYICELEKCDKLSNSIYSAISGEDTLFVIVEN